MLTLSNVRLRRGPQVLVDDASVGIFRGCAHLRFLFPAENQPIVRTMRKRASPDIIFA